MHTSFFCFPRFIYTLMQNQDGKGLVSYLYRQFQFNTSTDSGSQLDERIAQSTGVLSLEELGEDLIDLTHDYYKEKLNRSLKHTKGIETKLNYQNRITRDLESDLEGKEKEIEDLQREIKLLNKHQGSQIRTVALQANNLEGLEELLKGKEQEILDLKSEYQRKVKKLELKLEKQMREKEDLTSACLLKKLRAICRDYNKTRREKRTLDYINKKIEEVEIFYNKTNQSN